MRLLCQRCLAGTQLRRRAANGAKCRMFFKNFKNPLQGDSESAGARSKTGHVHSVFVAVAFS